MHDERSVRTAREGGVYVDIRSRFHRCEIFRLGQLHALVAGSTQAKALGVDAAVRVTEEQLGKYKYQIDIGGAGGTTYTGTISKLSMPGVLLHHETATWIVTTTR